MEENKNEEKVNIRHTINAEETFTLAKDVYDVRNLLKNIYGNRAVIGRRLNLLTMSLSLAYTLIYVAYILGTGLLGKLSLSADVMLYGLFGGYGALVVALFILTACSIRAKARNVKKYKRALSYLRLAVRLCSLALTVVALVFVMSGGEYAAQYVAFDAILIIVSIICLTAQLIPLLFGGLGKLARWLLSPVKTKYRFSAVALEWYELIMTSDSDKASVKRVSKKYYDSIGVCLDTLIIPALGRKYIVSIKPAQLLGVVDDALEEDKPLVEGIIKTIFAYAVECNYVTFDPCRDLDFGGSIQEEEKKPRAVKSRLIGIGKKIGMSLLDKYIDKSGGDND